MIRNLGQATAARRSASERLSTGLRINRASDDAAGLSIASTLDVDSRVFAQGMRNINDGVGFLAIADSASEALANLTMRQMELAEQASNGVYSDRQRLALDQESQQLSEEYNRIIDSTTFNGQRIYAPGPPDTLRIQAGYQTTGSLAIKLGEQISRDAGTGVFDEVSDGRSLFGGQLGGLALADLDGDGVLDEVALGYYGAYYGSNAYFNKGNGDGTFTRMGLGAGSQFLSHESEGAAAISAVDLNGDGAMDLAIGVYEPVSGLSRVITAINSGTGTFSSIKTTTVAYRPSEFRVGDFNNDGRTDLVYSDWSTDHSQVLLGNGSGGFSVLGATAGVNAAGDFNGDGNDDLLIGSQVRLGRGNGTFINGPNIAFGFAVADAEAADFNSDGFIDIFATDKNGSFGVAFGSAAATFTQISTFSGNSYSWIDLADVNSDSRVDLMLINRNSGVSTMLSNSDGTFAPVLAHPHTVDVEYRAIGDMNGDGVDDILTGDETEYTLALLNEVVSTPYAVPHSIRTVPLARQAMTSLRGQLQRIEAERGTIGAFQSRLSAALNLLSISRENMIEARSRIIDADIAIESSNSLRLSILQEAAVAVLAKANLTPQIALKLLKG